MKKILLILILIPFILEAQNISVKSFKSLPHSLDAKTYFPKEDQNGDKAALIKVVTAEKGLEWEGDGLGIVSTEPKTGEYWVYVPYGAKRLTIKHPNLGIIRDYVYPISIKEAAVYELVLTTGKVITYVVDYEIETQWMVITSEPDGASVYLNDEYKGETPFMEELPLGVYTYKLEYEKYKNSLGRIELNEANSKKTISVKLAENFGSLNIESSPESGARVYLDGEETGKVTPCLLTNIIDGTHTVTLKHQWYSPSRLKVTVNSKQTSKVLLKMKPIFGTVNITSNESSSIYVDDKYLGSGSVSKRLKSGYHTIKVKKDKHNEQTRKIKIEIGREKNVNFSLTEKTGKLILTSKPFDATVKLNGKVYGTTPLTIPNLLVGSYRLSIAKKGYSIIEKSITIDENKTLKIDEKLPSGRTIKITTKSNGAKVYIDNSYVGNSPVSKLLSFGEHTVIVNYKGEKSKKDIYVGSSGQATYLITTLADNIINEADDDYKNEYYYLANRGYLKYISEYPKGYRYKYAQSQISKIKNKELEQSKKTERDAKRANNKIKRDIKLQAFISKYKYNRSRFNREDFLSYDLKGGMPYGFTMARLNPDNIGFYISGNLGSSDDDNDYYNAAASMGITQYVFNYTWINIGLGIGSYGYSGGVFPELGLNFRMNGGWVLRYGIAYYGGYGIQHQIGIGFTY